MAQSNNQLTFADDSKTMVAYLSRVQERINGVLPKHMTAERMIRVVQAAVSRQPQLLKCTLPSLAVSVITASQMGLEPNSLLGHAYIVPRWNSKIGANEANLQIGYKGYIELARRSGNIVKLEAVAVHAGDKFHYTRGLHPDIVHEPNMDSTGQEPLIACYAIATFTDGDRQFEVMTAREIDGIRARTSSKMKDGTITGPWVTDYEEMAKKTVVRRLCKMLPLSVELGTAVSMDGATDGGEQTRIIGNDRMSSDEAMDIIDATADEIAEAEKADDKRTSKKSDEIAEKIGA